MNAFLALLRKDLKLYFSNRRALIVTFAAPIVIAAFFGSLMGGGAKPSRVPIAIIDQDRSPVSSEIVASLQKDPGLDVQALDTAAAVELVRKGKIRAAVVLPKNFGDEARRAMFRPGKKPTVTIHYDPSQSMVMPMVRGMLTQHVMKSVSQSALSTDNPVMGDFRKEIDQDKTMAETEKRDLTTLFDSIERVQKNYPAQAGKSGGGAAGFDMPFTTAAAEVTSGADAKYNGYAHSFAGMSVQFLMFMGIDIGVGLLLARRLGMWKRLRAAPLSRTLLLGSTVVSSALIAVILMSGIFAVGIAFFGVRIHGSWLGFAGVLVTFAFLTASFGLLLAAIGNNPEATRGLAIFATLIMVMLGGAWVPAFLFPEWLQTASLAVPTRWAIDGLAAMTWRGLGLDAALAPMAVMSAFALAFSAIAVWRFDWEE